MTGLNYSYLIYTPAGGHRAFRIVKVFKGTGKSTTIKLPEIEKVNADYLDGKLDESAVRERLESIRKKLYASDGAPIVEVNVHPDNQKILNAYWKSEYSGRVKTLVDSRSAYYRVRQAIEVAGPLSLKTVAKRTLQSKLVKSVSGSKLPALTSTLNSLLKFIGREFTLEHTEAKSGPIKFLTYEELQTLLPYLPGDEFQLLHEVAFGTGCRTGEAFQLDARMFNAESETIMILEQLDRAGNVRESRNAKVRTAYVLPEANRRLPKWFVAKDKLKHLNRGYLSRITKQAAIQAFPDRPELHITFSDLRHSYAVYLLRKGVPLGLVAACLGTPYPAAEKLYSQFESPTTAIAKLLKTK
jgi:integrase